MRILNLAKILCVSLVVIHASTAEQVRPVPAAEKQIFNVRGVVKELKTDGTTVVIHHEAIPNYMEAMTMPFEVRRANELAGIRPGDQVTFRFVVTESEGWIDQIRKVGTTSVSKSDSGTNTPAVSPKNVLRIGDPLSDYAFTNEFGKEVKFSDFKGNAFVFTFFFTRCPVPQFCPRLSKNFETAYAKISAIPNAPTNWHFFSITFDPEHDTPEVLKGYGQKYNYDPTHWSFLTASREKIDEITSQFGFRYSPDSGLFGHNFITVVVDANGILQTAWPIVGDTSENIVTEVLKGAKAELK